jgi:uncharacterized membrane protein HdeD (DUF308 family)
VHIPLENPKSLLADQSLEEAVMSGGESTPLIINAEEVALVETAEEISRNWAWIMAVGTANVIFGAACLMYPVLASQALELALTVTVFVAGVFHLSAVCFAAQGPRHQFFVLGVVQILLACLMYAHPYETLTVLTIFIAAVFMSLGSYQIFVAKENASTAARGLTVFSGVMAVFLSLLILVGMPLTSWYTVGVLLGVNHLNVGVARIIVSCYGRSIARNQGVAEAEGTFMPGWMV